MTIVLNRNHGIGMFLKVMFIVVLAISILTPALAFGNTGSNKDAADTSGGSKSFDDALNIIGDDGTINPSSTIATTTTEGGLSGFIAKFKTLISGLCGVLAAAMVGILVLNFTKLGASGDNDMARKKAMQGVMWSAVAVALFGGTSVFMGLSWNALS